MTVEEACSFFANIPQASTASCKTLVDVGLGYITDGPERHDPFRR